LMTRLSVQEREPLPWKRFRAPNNNIEVERSCKKAS
jgi:hypothetical protein